MTPDIWRLNSTSMTTVMSASKRLVTRTPCAAKALALVTVNVKVTTGTTALETFLVMSRDSSISPQMSNPLVQQAVRYALDYKSYLTMGGTGCTIPENIVQNGFPGALQRDASYTNLTTGSERIIGLEHYINVFVDIDKTTNSITINRPFFKAFFNTMVWTFVNVFFHVAGGIFLAVLLNRKLPGKPILRLLLILPWAVPQYIVALTWRGMFNNPYGAIPVTLGKIFGHDTFLANIAW